MINTSNEYKEAIKKNRTFDVEVEITLANSEKIILGRKEILSGGLKIKDGVSNTNSFDVGSAIINQCTLTIDNTDERYSDCDFEGAVIDVKVGLVLANGTEFLKKGRYISSQGKFTGAAITIECLDYMSKFDKPYTLSTLKYPATLGEIVRDACIVCGVSIGSATFENDDYIVKERPDDEALTFRQVLLWAGQIACKWWKCNSYGELVSGWYDTTAFDDLESELDGGRFDEGEPLYTSGDDVNGGDFLIYEENEYDGGTFVENGNYNIISSISAQNISTDDVVITGVRVTEEGENGGYYQTGEDGYVLDIEGNKFIQAGDGENVVSLLGQKLKGMRFRPLSVSCLSDPSMEAGDAAIVVDRKGRRYPCYITNTTFSVGDYQQISCDAATSSRNKATRYSRETQILEETKKAVREERTQRELAIEKLTNALAQSGGLFVTTEKQPDGSTIYYAHNKPTLEESDIIWKYTVEAIGISIDGGKTWPYGFMVTGDMISKILHTEGINADWINTGAISVSDESGKEIFYVNMDTGTVRIDADMLSIKGKNVETHIKEAQNLVVNDVEPEDKEKIWCDTSEDPPVFKKWDGDVGDWIIVNDTNDIINTVYQNVYSAIEQASDNIMLKVGEDFYIKDDIDKLLKSLSTEYKQLSDRFEFNFNEFSKELSDMADGTDAKFQDISKYIRFIDGSIELGQVGNPFMCRIKNDKIAFLENNVEIAYVANRKIYITDGEFLNSLKIGEFTWKPRKNGNLSLV